ncbi:MAG TPA: hypothetical protein DIT64_00680, partial [Verrucomicrobiales bacterium]|nr:hypothetical protein [Verrucomicrobiales bacterium]
MNTRFEPLAGLTVTVDDVHYDPSRPAPPDRPHPFLYHVSIHNGSPETVSIFGRKWIVRDTDGDGVADWSGVFAGGFNDELDGIGAGVVWHDGALYYTCIPNFWK